MDVSSLNQKHEEMLHKYVKFVQGTAYTATEGYDPIEELNGLI